VSREHIQLKSAIRVMVEHAESGVVRLAGSLHMVAYVERVARQSLLARQLFHAMLVTGVVFQGASVLDLSTKPLGHVTTCYEARSPFRISSVM
jgi:hypothetical protein